MAIAIVTGSAGLIGSEAVRFFSEKKFQVHGVDNDMRAEFFGEEASTRWNRQKLEEECPDFVGLIQLRPTFWTRNMGRRFFMDFLDKP